MHQFVHGAYHLHDAGFHLVGKAGSIGVQTGLQGGVGLQRAYPAVQHQREGAALGAGLYAQVLDQLAVGGQTLVLVAVKAPFGREVGIHHHKVAVHHIVAHGLQQKRLAAAVFAHDETEGGAALAHDFHIAQQGFYLLSAAHGDVGQADAGHHAALERVDHGLGNAPGYLGRGCWVVCVHVIVRVVGFTPFWLLHRRDSRL